MAAIVETIYDGGADKALDMSAGEAVRKLAIGNSWGHICLAVVFTVEDAGGLNPTSGYGFRIGLTTNGTRLISGTCPHAIHTRAYVAAWTKYSTYYQSTSNYSRYISTHLIRNGAQVQTVTATADILGMRWNITGNAHRSIQLMSFERYPGSTYRAYGGTQDYNTPTSDHLASGTLRSAMLAGSMGVAASMVECNYQATTTYPPLDEATYGNLDTVSIVWPWGTPKVLIHHVMAAKWA